ncbi:MAG TPA: hypothetical protein VIK22_02120 [Candidatus Anoxymicrobiaceae bacterium]
MPECITCGTIVPQGTKYCPRCGAAQQPPERAVPSAGLPESKSPPPPPVWSTQSGAQSSGLEGQPVAPGQKGKRLSRGAKLAIVLAVFALVLIVLAVVFGVVFFANVIGEPADVANNYVRAVNAGDLDTAWSYLSTATQREETRSGFDSKLGDLKGAISRWNTSNINVDMTGSGRATIVMNLALRDGSSAAWDMTLVKQNGNWKIRAVSPR